MSRALVGTLLLLTPISSAADGQWSAPVASAVPEADGYVPAPRAAVPPDRKRVYRAILDARKAAQDPSRLLPALNIAGSELNVFAAERVPPRNVKFAVVFHGAGLNGILDDAHYKSRFGMANPNLKVLSDLKKAGVELFVCGQNLAAENIDPRTLSPDVVVASDALIVLMAYQNDGYALMSF